jgi:hypothetical protein
LLELALPRFGNKLITRASSIQGGFFQQGL